MNIPRGGYPVAARVGVLTVTTATAVITLALPMSVSACSVGDSIICAAFSWITLAVACIGWADLAWHDILGRMILPSIDHHVRHHLCVLTTR